VEANQTEYKLVVEREKAMLNGIAPQQIVKETLLKEYPISNLYDENSSANVGIVLSLEDKDKTNLQHSELENKKKAKGI
jgi:multidrug efflux pump subunit AcrB